VVGVPSVFSYEVQKTGGKLLQKKGSVFTHRHQWEKKIDMAYTDCTIMLVSKSTISDILENILTS
jgi:hypothetical protein